MAKKQKNLQLPEDACQWLEQSERDSGVSQARIAMAALALYCASDDYTRKWYIWYSGYVIAGEISMFEIPRQMLEHEIENTELMEKMTRGMAGREDLHREAVGNLEQLKMRLKSLKELKKPRKA